MRVLGVDPGLTRCGIGVVEGSTGRALSLVHVEVVRTPAAEPPAVRLLSVADALAAAVSAYRPDVVVVERVFAQQNVRTVTGTAQAAGLAMVAAARQGIEVHLHTPSEVKAAITGSGTADKAQVTAMVTRILKLDVAPTPADAADALALAICHIWRGAAQARLKAALSQAQAGGRAPNPTRATRAPGGPAAPIGVRR
jgi:crossover junction endodeoxyribonuclease RuvC